MDSVMYLVMPELLAKQASKSKHKSVTEIESDLAISAPLSTLFLKTFQLRNEQNIDVLSYKKS